MGKTPFYEEGTYWGLVVDQGFGESKGGTPKFTLRCEIQARIRGEEESPVESYERDVDLWLTDKTMEYVARDLQSIGFPGGSLGQLDLQFHTPCDFRGKNIRLFCKHEEPNDKGDVWDKWSISTKREAKPIEKKPLAGSRLRDFDAMFGKYAKMKPKQTPTDQTGRPDDDIPF